jgi:hypothetical protein
MRDASKARIRSGSAANGRAGGGGAERFFETIGALDDA